MLKLNRSDQAKQCFLEALALDVKCYDSFEQLINGEMMSVDEGDRILPESLPSLTRV
jgi:anaphase-promoting complex subunit 6